MIKKKKSESPDSDLQPGLKSGTELIKELVHQA